MEYRIVRPDGTARWLHERGDVFRDEAGRAVRMLGIVQDITVRKEAEQLREDIERITRHDLKNPLNGIIGVPQVLLSDGNLDEGQKEMIKMVEQAGYSMLGMIDSSLSVYKMEQGTYQLNPERIDLLPIIRRIIAEDQNLMHAKYLGVTMLCNEREVELDTTFLISGEELLCYTMISHLLANALEAAPDHSEVRITLEIADSFACIRLHNDGAVPEAVRDRFFEKYATAGKSKGTGLGTYTAKLIAETHGGDISMSTSESEGTAITLRLPV